MLIDFSFENFLSYREIQQFSMLRSTSAKKHEGAAWERPDVSTVAGIYGGNAAGKSAMCKAFRFVRELVVGAFSQRTDLETMYSPFRLDAGSRKEPSEFLLDFVGTDDRRYRYELSVGGSRIEYESLRIYNGNRASRLYERELDGEEYIYRYGRAFTGPRKTYENMARPGVPYLSVLHAANVASVEGAYEFFASRMGFYQADFFEVEFDNIIRELKRDTPTARALTSLMARSDLGISFVETKTPLDELREASKRVGSPQEGGYEELAAGLLAVAYPNLTKEERHEQARSMVAHSEPHYVLSFTHKGVGGYEERFTQEEESRGTLAVLSFFSLALRLLSRRSVGVVDEIDTSLHPTYVQELVGLFKDPRTNPHQSQLIFTTHDASLIMRTGADERILDQDQIWLVEKSDEGKSSLYPLTAVRTRWDENFGRNYLHGVYGASPRPEFHEAFARAIGKLESAGDDYTAGHFGGEA